MFESYTFVRQLQLHRPGSSKLDSISFHPCRKAAMPYVPYKNSNLHKQCTYTAPMLKKHINFRRFSCWRPGIFFTPHNAICGSGWNFLSSDICWCHTDDAFRNILFLNDSINVWGPWSQWAHDAIITSWRRQNDDAMSFWRHNDVIFASCVRWDTFTLSIWFYCYDNQVHLCSFLENVRSPTSTSAANQT